MTIPASVLDALYSICEPAAGVNASAVSPSERLPRLGRGLMELSVNWVVILRDIN